jgi:hypothetical protein
VTVIGKHDVSDAVVVFERTLADAGLTAGELTADLALQAFGVFAAERFATGRFPDADGLLYQYGIHAFSGQDMFQLDMTRQFARSDDAGEHQGFVQFHCTLHYSPDPELAELGSHHQWWFHDSNGEPLHIWLAALQARPERSLLRARRPSAVDTASEDV